MFAYQQFKALHKLHTNFLSFLQTLQTAPLYREEVIIITRFIYIIHSFH